MCSLFIVIVAELNNVSNCLCAVRLIIIENRRLELEQRSVGRITRAVVLKSFSFVASSQQSCVTAAVQTFSSQDGRVQTVEPVNRTQGPYVFEESHDKASVAY